MFRFFVCLNLILVCVFCQTTEEGTTEYWDEQLTTGDSLGTDYVDDTTQSWQGNFTTTETTTCPPSISLDNLDEMKKDIINTIIANLSLEIANKIEEMEVRLSSIIRSNTNPGKPLSLSWQIYENLQVPLNGWLRVFDQPYSHKTCITDLNQAAGICRNEVLVGATYNQSIVLAAVGPATVLSVNTLWNQPQQFGQVYWYRTNGKSFGFAPDSSIRQTLGDNYDLTNSQRLSWILDQDIGGYRVGSTRSFIDDSLWHKIIYCN